MAVKYRTTGFVFKKSEMAEADQNFSVFTKDFGRVSLRARAVRKITSKLRADIDIFYLSEIEFIQGKNYKTLTDAVKIKKFGGNIVDIQKLEIAYKIADTLDNFLKGQDKDEAIFNLINEAFGNIFKIKNNQLIFQYFFWNFISLQGYKIEVDNCAVCKSKLNPNNIYFSNEDGGALCEKCLTPGFKQKINSDIIKVLRLIFKKDWQTLSKLKIEPASQKLLDNILESANNTFCPS